MEYLVSSGISFKFFNGVLYVKFEAVDLDLRKHIVKTRGNCTNVVFCLLLLFILETNNLRKNSGVIENNTFSARASKIPAPTFVSKTLCKNEQLKFIKFIQNSSL